MGLKCANCNGNAVLAEDLFLDWGQRDGTVDCYRVGSCEACKDMVREEIAVIFKRRDGNAANAFVAGCILHVRFMPQGGHRVVIWSHCKDFRSWDKTRWIFDAARGKRSRTRDERGQHPYVTALGNPRFVNRFDWRGWVKNPTGGSSTYEMISVEENERGLPYKAAFVRQWVRDLSADWQPTFVEGYPPVRVMKNAS